MTLKPRRKFNLRNKHNINAIRNNNNNNKPHNSHLKLITNPSHIGLSEKGVFYNIVLHAAKNNDFVKFLFILLKKWNKNLVALDLEIQVFNVIP